ncbi:MAG: ribosome maturation factor RimP [Acidobacteriota bacterium]
MGASPLFYCTPYFKTTRYMKREEAISKIRQITERVAAAAGIEIVDVELKGSGRHQMLCVVIDKPGGVTHADCELITREASDELDAIDPVAGPYEMEVSSPGVERPLKKWQDWERFVGQKVKVVLKEPLAGGGAGLTDAAADSAPPLKGRAKHPAKLVGLKHFDGAIARAENQLVTVELPDGGQITFPLEQVSRANLKFEW